MCMCVCVCVCVVRKAELRNREMPRRAEKCTGNSGVWRVEKRGKSRF